MKTEARLSAYAELQKTDFFRFFHVREVSSNPAVGGGRLVKLKTGGFQEFVDLELLLDRGGYVTSGRLTLDRGWVGDRKNINPFATDIAASFFAALSPPADRSQANLVVEGIRNLRGESNRVLNLRGTEPPSSVPPDVARLREAIRGERGDSHTEMQAARLQAVNSSLGQKKLLQLAIVATVPAEPEQPESPEAFNPTDPATHGATLLGMANVLTALSGETPTILLNDRYRDFEPQLRRNSMPANDLLLALSLLANCSKHDQAMIEVAVFDGRTAHAINIVDADPGLERITYFDPWGQGSFLQAANNGAGVDATQSKNNPRLWLLTSQEFLRVLYGAVLLPDHVQAVQQVLKELEKPEQAIASYSDLRRREPNAVRSRASTWQRIGEVLLLQARHPQAVAALRVAQALSPSSGTIAAKLCRAYATSPGLRATADVSCGTALQTIAGDDSLTPELRRQLANDVRKTLAPGR